MHSNHLVIFVRWEVFDSCTVRECEGVDLFLQGFLFLLFRGLPCAHKAPVASHLLVSGCRSVYVLKICSFLSCILRSVMVPAVILVSFAYPWSSYVRMADEGLWGWLVGR